MTTDLDATILWIGVSLFVAAVAYSIAVYRRR